MDESHRVPHRIRIRFRRAALGLALAAAVALGLAPGGATAQVAEIDLTAMDLEDLMELEVTSVSKRAQKVSEAAAAVFVITQDDIRRSGALSIPELLRMVPGMHVAQIDANHWAVSSRGFSEEFANKLLVMIDGRSIYTPLFSGVLWSEHDMMLEDIERIEVVRGPGGTMWGANAVNGVINIITKSSADTQGVLASTQAGTYETFTGATRVGGSIGDDVHYRIYAKLAGRDGFLSQFDRDESANDEYKGVRTGARMDVNVTEEDIFTIQGDFYQSEVDKTIVDGTPLGQDDVEDNQGGNVLARYTHAFSDRSEISLQTWWDHTNRHQLVSPPNLPPLLALSEPHRPLEEVRDTFDIELRHSVVAMPRNHLVWGAGYRYTTDEIQSSSVVRFRGDTRSDNLANFFVQDEISIVENLLTFTAGSKFEHNDYTGWEFQPSGRLLLTPGERHSVWGAISRAVRTPSRADDDVQFGLLADLPFPPGAQVGDRINGNRSIRSEKLLAYELGYRSRPIDPVTIDVAAYYNDYDDLRTAGCTLPTPPGCTPLLSIRQLANEMKGRGYGTELSASWAVTDFWHLITGYTFTRLDLELKNGSTDTTSLEAQGRTPRHQVSLRSKLNLPWNLQLDSSFYWVDAIRDADEVVPAYERLDVRLAWTPIDDLELSLVGLNIIEPHREFPNGLLTQASVVPRMVYGSIRWNFR